MTSNRKYLSAMGGVRLEATHEVLVFKNNTPRFVEYGFSGNYQSPNDAIFPNKLVTSLGTYTFYAFYSSTEGVTVNGTTLQIDTAWSNRLPTMYLARCDDGLVYTSTTSSYPGLVDFPFYLFSEKDVGLRIPIYLSETPPK